jgi:hypothetical protein
VRTRVIHPRHVRGRDRCIPYASNFFPPEKAGRAVRPQDVSCHAHLPSSPSLTAQRSTSESPGSAQPRAGIGADGNKCCARLMSYTRTPGPARETTPAASSTPARTGSPTADRADRGTSPGSRLVANFSLKFYCIKRRFPVISKYRHIHGVLNIDEIKN